MNSGNTIIVCLTILVGWSDQQSCQLRHLKVEPIFPFLGGGTFTYVLTACNTTHTCVKTFHKSPCMRAVCNGLGGNSDRYIIKCLLTKLN